MIETWWGQFYLWFTVLYLAVTCLSFDRTLIFLAAINASGWFFTLAAQSLFGDYATPVSFMAIDTLILACLLPMLANQTHRDIIGLLIALTLGWYLVHGLQIGNVFPDDTKYLSLVNIIYILFGFQIAWRARHGIAITVEHYLHRFRGVDFGSWSRADRNLVSKRSR